MPKVLGSALDIPAAVTAAQAVRKGYVDSADVALAARVAALEAGGGGGGQPTGGQTLSVRSVTSSVTAAAGDFILADATSGALTVTLPNAPPANTSVAAKKVDNGDNLVTVVGQAGAKIDGDVDLVLLQAQSGAVMVYDGTNWRVESTVIFDPGATNLTYRGTWVTGLDYGFNDVVFYNGSSYVAMDPSNSVTPNAAGPEWALLVAQGDPGSGASSGYRHDQVTPASVWQITHALGYDPGGLTVVSDAGDTIDDAIVQYLIPGQSLRLAFDISLAGSAYLS